VRNRSTSRPRATWNSRKIGDEVSPFGKKIVDSPEREEQIGNIVNLREIKEEK
jgi:hypothetical protein